MKTEKIVLGNEMETPSWSLRKEILNFDEALTAYDHMLSGIRKFCDYL
jgi:hypothetical protein